MLIFDYFSGKKYSPKSQHERSNTSGSQNDKRPSYEKEENWVSNHNTLNYFNQNYLLYALICFRAITWACKLIKS